MDRCYSYTKQMPCYYIADFQQLDQKSIVNSTLFRQMKSLDAKYSRHPRLIENSSGGTLGQRTDQFSGKGFMSSIIAMSLDIDILCISADQINPYKSLRAQYLFDQELHTDV